MKYWICYEEETNCNLSSVRTPDNVETVRRAVLAFPRRSTRRQNSALDMPHRTLLRILHDDLKFHPYIIMIVQQVTERDFEKCRVLCKNASHFTDDLDAALMLSDEVHFHLNGYVNKQKCGYWAAENPRELYQSSPQRCYSTYHLVSLFNFLIKCILSNMQICFVEVLLYFLGSFSYFT